jgi:hypothetical protein
MLEVQVHGQDNNHAHDKAGLLIYLKEEIEG